jgi:hypothetical protein
MGKSGVSGPFYGAKSLLWSQYIHAATSQATTALASPIAFRVVPAYEDWFLTEYSLNASTMSSAGNNFILKTEGGSTSGIPRTDGVSTRAATLFTVSAGTSTTVSTGAAFTPSAGEYEGTWIPAGSTLRLVSSGINPQGPIMLNVMGYVRYIDSTRAGA